MFRLSDYDFESCEKDYMAFMDVFKKFLTLCRAINEPSKGYFTEDEMIEHAEEFALEYIAMRINSAIAKNYNVKTINNNIILLVDQCADYLDYPDINIETVEDLDDMLWNIYGDLS